MGCFQKIKGLPETFVPAIAGRAYSGLLCFDIDKIGVAAHVGEAYVC